MDLQSIKCQYQYKSRHTTTTTNTESYTDETGVVVGDGAVGKVCYLPPLKEGTKRIKFTVKKKEEADDSRRAC
jgi:hypothetical protein